jgi:hypothetical protein
MTLTVREQISQQENTVFLANLVETRITTFGTTWKDTLGKIQLLKESDPVEAQTLLNSFHEEVSDALHTANQMHNEFIGASLPAAGAWSID